MEENKFDYTKYKKIINNAAAHYGFNIAEHFSSEYKAHKNDDPDFLINLGRCMFELGSVFRSGGNVGDFPNLKRLDVDGYMLLEKQYLKFCHRVGEDLRIKQEIIEELNIENTSTPSINVKLNFTGNSNQVYDVFRQLKRTGFISNTFDELVDFILNHVQFKDGREPGRSTISAELKKDNRPMKGKRFDPE